MPTYEYACAACGHEWEQMQRITEAPIEVCPTCAANAAHRLISGGTNFILKGGGWYSDLYSSAKAPAKKEETGSSSAPAEGSKTEAKSDKGPAAPAASTPSGPSTPAAPTPASSSST
jgi:putative FmdB family regulatory protein